MKHTKGPWEVWIIAGTGLPGIVAHNGPTVAEVTKWTSAGNSNPEVMQANARLIAAAPELLEALMVTLDQVDYTAGAGEPTEMVGALLPKEIIEMGRRAIAKANGE